ncbi:acyl-CoA carboxylase epsilon subunit [Plantactinospora sp. CA-290183]|uniref:acyl-CoA carboxylase epsilon subunit n=1 Tax=Plantactinospora sp. CA-290183 TaxID=3240006 RepID=UPI003D8F1ED7
MFEREPALRVVRGTPTAEELAALVAAVLLRSRSDTPARPAAVSTWARSARPGAVPTRAGIDAWRVSGLPR